MVAGHLREQNGYFQMILSWKGADGKRKSKSISTGLAVKGNKKRAEAMLLKTRKEFNPENLLENADMPFHVFLNKWLKKTLFPLAQVHTRNMPTMLEVRLSHSLRNILLVCSKCLDAIWRHFIAMKDRNTRLLRRNCCNTTR